LFQTETNLAIQALASPPLTWLMSAVTLLGYLPAYAVAALTLAFAVRLRPALAVVGAMLLTGLLTDAAKNAIAFPRPDEVDPRVAMTADARPLPLSAPGGGRSFWALPQPEAIEAVRRRASGNYGFPSGHVAAAAAFLVSTAWFFRSRRTLAFSAAWVPLMALSRLYLGRHFLADVCGGLALGLVSAAASVLLFRPLGPEGTGWPERRALRPVFVLALAAVVFAPFAPELDPHYPGGLAGIALACAALGRAGPPADGGRTRQKIGRIALAVLLLAAAFLGAEALFVALGAPAAVAAVVSGAASVTAAFAGTVAVGRRIGLFDPRP
jgi:membrane-associated phospholipid phosphatase